MVKLPTLADLPRAQAQTSGRIISIGGGEAEAATRDLGRAIAGEATKLYHEKQKFNYAAAKSQLLRESVDAMNELEGDDDYGTYQARYDERMTKARDRLTGSIPDFVYRNQFELDTDDFMLGAGDKVRQLAKAKETDVAKGAFYDMREQNKAAMFATFDEKEKEALRTSVTTAALAGANAGYWSKEEAAKVRTEFDADYARARLEAMPADKQIEALGTRLGPNGEAYFPKTGTFVDFLPAEERATKYAKIYAVTKEERKARAATALADGAMAYAGPALRQSGGVSAFDVLLQAESGGKQFADDGTPLTSPKGAIGIAQVMPATGPEAAKLAGLEWDEDKFRNDPEYNKALGRAYFGKQMEDFGNVQLAYAAYNAGPGAVREALKKAEKDWNAAQKETRDAKSWLEYLPEETQNYVTNNTAKLNAPKRQKASLADLQKRVREEGRAAGLDDDAIRDAESETARRYKLEEEAVKQERDGLKAEAFRLLDENGGDFTAIPADVRESLTPEDKSAARAYAAKVGKGEPLETDWTEYARLYGDQKALAQYNLAANKEKFADAEFKQLVRLQADAKKDDPAKLTRIRNASAVMKQYLAERDVTQKDDPEEYGKAQSYFENLVWERESESGKKLNPKEMNELAAWMFATTVPTRGALYGTNDTPIYDAQIDRVAVPDDFAANMRAAFKRQGYSDAAITKDMITKTYLRSLGR
jgi:hypothetical protein